MPFGYWLVRIAKGVDIRTVGSGNIGATNVWRTYGRRFGLPIVVLDIAKGFVPTVLATQLAGPLAGALTGGAAMAGHYRPVFLRFARGGKAVATGGGVYLGLAPLLFAFGLAVWAATFVLSRYASLASITTAVAMPVGAGVARAPWPVIVFSAIASFGVLLLHRPNIARLRAGTESRFSFRRG